MIDLSQTRTDLLAQIQARESPGESLSDITDPRIASSDAHVRLLGSGREDLFPLLKLALAERFAAVPRVELTRDLLMPVKHALGNAYKHGNATDPAKAVSVEIVLTGKGAFIAVTDQGTGFDVARTVQRFQQQENYFQHFGIGFRNLHRAKSTVSYENGGRTALLCFRHRLPPSEPPPGFGRRQSSGAFGSDFTSESARGLAQSETLPRNNRPPFKHDRREENSSTALTKVLDAEWMRNCLSAELSEFASGHARLESCRVYPSGEHTGDDCGNRYVLRVGTDDGSGAKTRILTGRLHATEAAAKADFEDAARLHEAKLSKSLRRPRPVARPAGEPRLVLYDFDSWMNLWEYHAYRGSLKFLRRLAAKTGRALARLHRSQIAFPDVKPDDADEELQVMDARAEATLQTLAPEPELVNRFRVLVQRVRGQAALRPQRVVTPIHGAFGWDSIHYGVDGKFYLYRFEKCRRADPVLDVAGFSADLLCFTLASYDEAAYRLCNDSFLLNYNSRAKHPINEDELRLYLVLALCERLEWAQQPCATASASQLLAALGAALSERGFAAARKVAA
jgi:anti-sigma regulatory factor (Ser/Thr protein kinase)